ncbi:NUDIX domain-containing protein [Glutamicibacter sp.]|uniref:NUDIX domain-containing protein n=1 Tax=Glutamicibacter sp. TaxID=1931995 RepID=UPI003D6C3274
MEEQAALFDERGREIGQAPRSRVRAENLRHGATGILVFNPEGEVFVHQRTMTKDVYPGLLDFAAGGVIQAGEDPDASARREAQEELGIDSDLVPLDQSNYADAHTRYRAFRYWTIACGELSLQADEVASGRWMEQSELLADIERNRGSYMPDTVELFFHWLKGLSGKLPPAK